VLGLPPAFVLSQDQTLMFESIKTLKIEFLGFEAKCFKDFLLAAL
jgi:hypothetical protein